MKRYLAPVLWMAGLAYPFAVYLSLNRVAVAWLVLPLALLWLLRACTSPTRTAARGLALAMAGFCLTLALVDALALTDSRLWLRAYPVLVSAMLLALFWSSLYLGTPMIEQIARLRHPDLPPQAVVYTRKVTRVWCAFFATNGAIAAALALWGSWSWWTLYNGAISYALAGALLLGEWVLRPAQGKAEPR